MCSGTQSCPTLCDPMDWSPPDSSLFMGFSRQEYQIGLPFPFPRDMDKNILRSSRGGKA